MVDITFQKSPDQAWKSRGKRSTRHESVETNQSIAVSAFISASFDRDAMSAILVVTTYAWMQNFQGLEIERDDLSLKLGRVGG